MIFFSPTLFQLLVSSYHLQGQVKAENNREIRHWPGFEWLHLREAMSWFIERSISKFDISLRSMILIGRKAFLLKMSGTWDIFCRAGNPPTYLLGCFQAGWPYSVRVVILTVSNTPMKWPFDTSCPLGVIQNLCHSTSFKDIWFCPIWIDNHLLLLLLLLLIIIIIIIIISILRLMKHIQIFYLGSPASLFVSLGSRIWKMKKSKCDSESS